MSNPAAFQASYADFKLIKGRKCAQIILEVAIEAADAALEALGGVPQPHRETWVGVARIDAQPSIVRQQLEASVALIEKPEKERRSWSALSYAEQAGIRCNEPDFWRFLNGSFLEIRPPVTDAHGAAAAIRIYCDVKSRADIRPNTSAASIWEQLDSDYESWSRKPAF